MSARYLVRFDDICPTMDWPIWSRVERTLLKHGVKPLLAVVPDNQDPLLRAGPERADFWDYIRQCQSRGWSIAMHGWQHKYETQDPGLLRINRYSEFAGLPYATQQQKIKNAIAVFAAQNVRIDAWIAPGHNFDANTLRVLQEANIRVVSDGFYYRPVLRLDALWIPQQIWRFRKMPAGTWTVCYHPNQFSEQELQRFEQDIERYKPSIVDLPHIVGGGHANPPNFFDRMFSALWRAALLGKNRLRT